MFGTTLDPWLLVFIVALGTALATGLGALPFLVFRQVSNRGLAVANAAAAGLMTAASIGLILEGAAFDLWKVALGLVLGGLLVAGGQRLMNQTDVSVGELQGADARKVLLIVGVMTVHSFAEGIGVGVAFAGTESLAAFISIAIAIHNVPEGVAISLIMIPRGAKVWQAAGWSVFSSLPQPLMAVPAFLFVNLFEVMLPVGLGLAAGAMLWMVIDELMPEAMEELPLLPATAVAGVAAGAMFAFQEFVLKGV